ncbi:MAG TPA: NADH-quinone oxidoreductase subunit C [Candidatus Polarisedimenticolia bacterium]|jgi:NADH-quinone oxidoreductase subunit C|nr:NADH-quinone oxidoreductase subunit C [Candidatus Polarisedimenticolia bacterium]
MGTEPLEVVKVREKFGAALKEVVYFRGEETLVLEPSGIRPICAFLKSDPEMSFNLLLDIAGIHFLEREYSYEVIYHLLSLARKRRLRLRVRLGEEGEIDSVVPVWRTADWHEREAFDLVGIRFKGHPDLRRILMPEDFVGHPLRKDFPLEQ